MAAMRKPPRAVWALNHLALRDDPHLADLLDAIDAVGAAGAATHREAVAALRDRIGDTVDAAVAAIEAPRSEDHPEITRVLQAVVGDPDALRLLVDGRLVDVPVGGMGALGLLPPGGADVTPRAPRSERRSRPKLGVPRPPAPEPADDEVQGDEVEEEEEGRTADVDDSMAERRVARERRRVEQELASAQAAHEAASTAREAADGAVAEAEERLAAADDEVAAAEAALTAARARRDEQDAALAEARWTSEAALAAEVGARSAADAARAEFDALDP